ncbi:MAG: hypothetical protein EBZ61_09560 [Micrococcales bacterium]|nr:hypothetical protein [Micrococcales bacterium]
MIGLVLVRDAGLTSVITNTPNLTERLDMYTDEQVEAMWKQGDNKKPYLLVLYNKATKKEWEPQTFYAESLKQAKALAIEWQVRFCGQQMRVQSVQAVS